MTMPNNHSQYATFDDGVLSAGAALYAGLALRRLAAASTGDSAYDSTGDSAGRS